MMTHSNVGDIIKIDGSYGEGGGQILRTALALSMITGQPVEFYNLRVKRPNPGLQPQHLTAIHAAATVSNARVEGAIIGSTELRFEPSEVVGGEFLFDIEDISGQGSAGAVALVAQTVLIPLALKGQSAKITLMGGTHVGWSPGTDYLEYVYIPALRHFGIEARIETLEAGFYPRGGGRAILYVEPAQLPLQPIDWRERGKLKRVRLVFTLSNLPESILRRGDQAAETLIGLMGLQPEFVHRVLPSRGFGLSATLAVEAEHGYAGFIRLGRRGVAIEQVVEEAWNEFTAWAKTRTAVDYFLSDQLILPALFANGSSTWTTHRATSHLRTLLWLVPQLIKTGVELTQLTDGNYMVRILPGEENINIATNGRASHIDEESEPPNL
ncbi:MAG: RNA 3'-phosphate cyclase [Armatimonadetes bacterium JP3_11]|jgi:RNA 3'-terminal phosphate cyclase (ATP)|nr:MAG: RNA 3'-phosphate cyclase [Armatimonadetes bacterium CP1_7O]OYT74329.1 MAG: RNA 3'-phosphate cyclase [Armatimonadetes bacterium JP3_11]RMH05767.1 MAG: RNA 3'-phosphate cyclase [Armatimonadota bacterium]